MPTLTRRRSAWSPASPRCGRPSPRPGSTAASLAAAQRRAQGLSRRTGPAARLHRAATRARARHGPGRGASGRRRSRTPTSPEAAAPRRRTRARVHRWRADDDGLPTGYALRGRTASGLPTGWGIVAVDPSVIPLGTRMTIPGYGEGVAADTGGAVHGATIDLWFPSRRPGAGVGPQDRDDHAPRLDCPQHDAGGHDAAAGTDRASARLAQGRDRGRPRPLSHGPAQPARGAGGPGRRGSSSGERRSPVGSRARSRRRGDGPEHAGDDGRRGDAADHWDRTAYPSAGADDLGPGQRRPRRDPRGRVRLPAEGLLDPGADGRDPGGVDRRVADLSEHRSKVLQRVRSTSSVPRSRRRSAPNSPTARSRC